MDPLLIVSDRDEIRLLTGDERRRRQVVLVDPRTHYATHANREARQLDRGFDGTHIPAGSRWDPAAGFVPDPDQARRLAELDEDTEEGAAMMTEGNDLGSAGPTPAQAPAKKKAAKKK